MKKLDRFFPILAMIMFVAATMSATAANAADPGGGQASAVAAFIVINHEATSMTPETVSTLPFTVTNEGLPLNLPVAQPDTRGGIIGQDYEAKVNDDPNNVKPDEVYLTPNTGERFAGSAPMHSANYAAITTGGHPTYMKARATRYSGDAPISGTTSTGYTPTSANPTRFSGAAPMYTALVNTDDSEPEPTVIIWV